MHAIKFGELCPETVVIKWLIFSPTSVSFAFSSLLQWSYAVEYWVLSIY